MKSRLFFFYFNVIECLVFGCCCWLSTASVPTWFCSPSEHREPTEAHPPWGPGTLSDGWGCALPPRQSPSPVFSCRHPCSLASSSRSPSVCVAMNAPPSPCFQFYRLSLFPAQTRHGQVSAKCGELPGGLQETGGTRGKTAICPVISLFPQFVSSVNWGPCSCLFSPLIFTSVNLCESGTWIMNQLAPWAANAAILPSIKLLVTALAEMNWKLCWGKSREGNQIGVQQDTRTISAVLLFFVASHTLQNKYYDCFCAVQWKK